ncbi:MAG: hypothetical protein II911_07055, partial [Clostridia bacterium]|nr:hypothetical protein [Clostridia bacterium]
KKHKYMIRLQDKHEYEVETADATMYLFGDLVFDKDAYTIDFDGDFVSRNTLHLTVKETF